MFRGLIHMQTTLLGHRSVSPINHQLFPRLARRDPHETSSAKAWKTPGFGASTAFVSLSPGLVCAFEGPDGEVLTHQEVGDLGLSPHQAWNAAAQSLRATAITAAGVQFFSRPASVALGSHAPRGVEVRGDLHTAAAWCAHPLTFGMLHAHFSSVLSPTRDLVFFSRDQRELFVFDADQFDVARALGHEGVLLFSLGFPLLARTRVSLA